MRNWTTRRNKVILAGFLMTEETSLQLGELRNEEWGGGKACCFQLLSWFSFSLKMYLNSSRQEAGARLSFYHAAYSVFTNPCSPKILAIIIQLQGTYLFTALLCITTCPQGSTSERKRRRKEQRMNEIIIISWFMKGCFFFCCFCLVHVFVFCCHCFGLLFLWRRPLSNKSNSLRNLKKCDISPPLFQLKVLHFRLWFLNTFPFTAVSA